MSFDHLSSHALTARLGELLATERRTIVDFLLHLAELDRRRLHLELGYGSLFAFCTEHLKLTKAAAYRRTTAVELIGKYPSIAEMLRDGRLNLTTLCDLRDVLTDESHTRVLDLAAGKTEKEVAALVAALKPRPAPDDLLRRLPAQAGSGPEPAATADVSRLPACEDPLPAAASAPTFDPKAPAPTALPASRRPSLEPISSEQYVLRITVDRTFVDDLERLKSLLSHSLPDGNMPAVLHAAIRRTIVALEKQRRGADVPRPRKQARPPRGRAIWTAVQREVWSRDGARCAYVSPDGKRCGSAHQLEFHHVQPVGKGGASTVDNISIRCRAHNLYAAELDYGKEVIDVARRRAGPGRR